MSKHPFVYVLAAFLAVAAPAAGAQGAMGAYGDYPPPPAGAYGTPPPPPESYGTIIGKKVGSGFSNIGLGFMEIPKNIINTSNQYNLAMGVTLGAIKGVIHMCGRAMSGTLDLLTFPLPSEPLTTPQFVWEKFDTETRYNAMFKVKQQ